MGKYTGRIYFLTTCTGSSLGDIVVGRKTLARYWIQIERSVHLIDDRLVNARVKCCRLRNIFKKNVNKQTKEI